MHLMKAMVAKQGFQMNSSSSVHHAYARRLPAWLWVLCLMLFLDSMPVWAARTGANGGSTWSTAGITATWSGGGLYGWGGDTFASGGYWTDPYTATGVPASASTRFYVPQSIRSGTATVTVTFNQPVDNPILHIDRLGGYMSDDWGDIRANTSHWTLTTTGVSMTKLSGNPQFQVTSTTFQRANAGVVWSSTSGSAYVTASGECGASATSGTACGSIQFNGNNITNLTFSVQLLGPALYSGGYLTTDFDGIEAAWSFPVAQVRVGKISQGGTGTFGFSYANASPAPSAITTSAANTVAYTTTGYSDVTDNSASITVAEPTLAAGFAFKSVTCVNDTTGMTVVNNQTSSSTVNITTGTIGTAANMYDPGDRITCTYTNARTNLTLVKQVINDNGGSQPATAWTLRAAGPTTISGPTGSSAVTSAAVAPGTYTLSETGPPGYEASLYSCVKNGAAAVLANSITLALGDTAVCTVTNDDLPARLRLVKVVVNDNGGTATASDFNLDTSAGAVTFGTPTGTAPTLTYTSNVLTVNPGTYTLSEADVADYDEGTWSCSGSGVTMGASAYNAGSVTLAAGADATCTIINNDSNSADLMIAKSTTSQDGVVVEQPIEYSLLVTNQGPATVTGAVVKDTPGAGLTCPADNTVACSGPGCPASTQTVGTLTGTGITLGTLTAGQSLTLTFSCNVQ